MPLIEIGKDKWGNIVSLEEDYGYGVVIIIAQPRYGKSILLKNMYVQMAEHRNIIIFDYQNEHSGVKYGNWLSHDSVNFIPELYTIENFAFYLSDFDQIADWISMGFTTNAAPLIFRLVKNIDIHNNTPLKMIEILRELPVSKDDLEDFNDEYPELNIKDTVNFGVKQSIIGRMVDVWETGLIIPEVGSDDHQRYRRDKIHIDDWIEFIENHPHLNINLNMVTSGEKTIARASVGKILEKLYPALHRIQPLVVFEEADLLCPPTTEFEHITSATQIKKLINKDLRKGAKVMLITQHPHLLDQEAVSSGMTFIFGIHKTNATFHSLLDGQGFDYERDVINKLRRDKDEGIREFGLIETGETGKYRIFQPMDSATLPPFNFSLKSDYIYHNKIQATGQLKNILINPVA